MDVFNPVHVCSNRLTPCSQIPGGQRIVTSYTAALYDQWSRTFLCYNYVIFYRLKMDILTAEMCVKYIKTEYCQLFSTTVSHVNSRHNTTLVKQLII